MISKKLAKQVLEAGLVSGADFAELYYEEEKKNAINLDNGVLEGVANVSSSGVGIRLLKGDHSVYGYTNDLKGGRLIALAQKLANGFHGQKVVECRDFINQRVKNINPNDGAYFKTPIQEKIAVLKQATQAMKEVSPLVTRALVSFVGDQKKIEIYNSDGLHVKDSREHTRLVFRAEASRGDQHESAFAIPGTTGNMDYFKTLDINQIARNTAQEAIEGLDAKECPSGKMDVIIGNATGGVLFHEACGHSLEASAVARNLSVFANRQGEQIASPLVNAYDDGTMPGYWGTNNIDDEGHPTERTCLIKNGVLNDYLVDRFFGQQMKHRANGACRRQSYKYEPITRMSNTYIDNGTSTVEEIIKNTKLGLYAKSLRGGSVMPTTGQFEFACGVAYIVRDGKIAERVRGATLIGSGEEVLKNIDMIANDLDLDTGYCGSASGSVPVGTGQPTLRVKNLLVGGNGGKLA
ncbi:MAG: TldD/PmbA family protein [Bacilli bacterium]|nr:TldD/PmbA family protein [Bacilli bacterium]